MTKYTDESIMPLGKYKGQKLANVPAQHLLWLYDQPWFTTNGPLGKYIDESRVSLLTEARNDKQFRR